MYVSFIAAMAELMMRRVPAADAKISQQAMDETFYLSNVAPQVGDGFNRHCGSFEHVTNTF